MASRSTFLAFANW